MAETFTDKIKLSKRDTGDLNWGAGENANKDLIDKHLQLSVLRPPRILLASLGSGAVGANLSGSTTYFYKVTAFNAAGETTENQIPSVVEAQVTEPSTPVPVILQWETVKGASGYRIYKSTITGQEKFLAEATGESTLTYTDTGNTATNGAISVPTLNTARASVSKIVAGTNVTINPPDGTGDVTINAQPGAAGVTSLRKEGEALGLTGDVKLAPGAGVGVVQDGVNNKITIDNAGVTGLKKQGEASSIAGDVALEQGAGVSLTQDAPNKKITVANAGVTGVRKFGEASPLTSDVKLEAGANVTLTQDGAQNKITIAAVAGGGGYVKVVVAAPSGVAATDQSNIQAALDSIGTDGGIVLLREGIYQATGSFTVKPKTRIQGQGMEMTTIKAPNLGINAKLFQSSTFPDPSQSIEFVDLGFDWSLVQGEDTALLSGTGGGTNTIDHVKILRCKFKGHSFLLRMHMTNLGNGSAYGWEIAHCVFDGNQRTEFNLLGPSSVGMVYKTNIHHNTFKNSATQGNFVRIRTQDTVFAANIIHSQAPSAIIVERSDSMASSLDSIINSNLIFTGSGQNALYIRSANGSFVGNRLIGGGKILMDSFANGNFLEANGGDIELSTGALNNSVIGNKGTLTDNSGASNTIVSTFVSGVRKLGEASPLLGDVKIEAGSNITLTQVAASNKITIAAAGGGGMVKIDEQFLTHLATSFNPTSIDADNDRAWLILLRFGVPGTAAGVARLIFNNDTNFANYRRSGTVLENDVHNVRGIANDPEVFPYTSYAYGMARIWVMNTKPSTVFANIRGISEFSMYDGVNSAHKVGQYMYTQLANLSGVVSMQLQFTSGLAGSSHLLVYKVT